MWRDGLIVRSWPSPWAAWLLVLREVITQPIETALPRRAAPGDPFFGRAQRARLDAAGAHPAGLFRLDQAAVLQDLQVLHHRRQRHVERLGQFADRGRSAAQAFHNYPPGRVGQRLKYAIERAQMVKHMLNLL